MPDDTVIDCEVVARLLKCEVPVDLLLIKRAAFKNVKATIFAGRPGYTA